HPIFQYLNMRLVYKPEVLIAQVNKKLDENGHLTDEMSRDVIKKQLQALKDLIFQLSDKKQGQG
ncbi:MAG TPA: NAD(P)H-dependent oxidoreductase, partial [Segetibacter sp.]